MYTGDNETLYARSASAPGVAVLANTIASVALRQKSRVNFCTTRVCRISARDERIGGSRRPIFGTRYKALVACGHLKSYNVGRR